VIWIGLDDGVGELRFLQQRLVSRLKKIGLPIKKQKFSPHITLARIKGPVSGHRIQTMMDQVAYPPVSTFPVECIHLYKSRLSRAGAVHTGLYTSRLSGFCG